MAGKEFEFGFKIAAFIQGNFKSSFGSANKEISELNDKIKENRSLLKTLKQAQKDGVITATSYKNAVAQINPEIERLTKAQQKYINQQSKLNGLQEGMRSHGANALQYAGMAYSVAQVADAAVKFESSMADVRKVVDFDSPEQFKQMGKDILDLSTRIPMAAEGLAQIVAAGGQSGIARDELLGFAESAAKMGVAFDITAEQAGDMMAKWRTAFKMGQSDVVKLADKINFLGNTTAASAPLISDVVTRIGPLGSVGGVASGEIAALGASLVGSGVTSEIAATGIKNLILALVSGESATKSQNEAFAALGLNAVDMAKYMQKDARGAILSVLEAVQRLDKEQQASVMAELFGKESISAIAPLLSNLDALKTNFDAVSDASKYAGSMEKEFQTRAETTANAMELMNNSIYRTKVAIGQGLLPAIAPVASVVADAATAVGNFATEYPNLTGAVLGGTGALFGVAAAASAFMWALNGARLALFGAKTAFGIAGAALGKYNILIKTGTALTYGWNLAGRLFNSGLAITGSMFKGLGVGAMKLWGILLANPWIALATVAVGAAWMIYKNWDTVKEWFTTLWDDPALALQQFCDGVKSKLGEAYDWIHNKWESISNFLSSPIFGSVNITASGQNGQKVAQNAYGGIYGKGAFLTSFAERDGESAIPHTPNKRNVGLLAATNAIMGNPLGGVNINATFNPQITVQGGTSDTAAQIDNLMTQKMREFEEMLKRVAAQQRRLSYA
ncbi:phage tail tape measure protein [Phascolarctobacterium faecium]|nr:phage tail tape measure protein [Phascolarctobacterium faecium]MDM8111494.1 phage tail tape measure protein [Phascolarctobacterium faecium]